MDWTCQTRARCIPNTSARSANSSDITVAVLTNVMLLASRTTSQLTTLESIIHSVLELTGELRIVNVPFYADADG